MGKRLIIINRMYAGKYLTERENIGHEIINLIRSDNGNNYLWLNADGNCDISKFLDKSGKCRYDEIIMLLVRMNGYRQWKILGKAEVDTSTISIYMAPKYGEEYNRRQIEIIDEEKIYYGGQALYQIFSENYHNGQNQKDTDLYFTFKARNIVLPVFNPVNIEKTVLNIKELNGLANQSLRMYLTDDKNIETYKKFNEIVNGNMFEWNTENTTQKVDTKNIMVSREREYFLRIINEEYRELTFSNLLAYFLKNKSVMSEFAKEVLGLSDFREDFYSIAREEKNMDIFISSPDNYIIIENKIRSNLIQEKKFKETKLKEYGIDLSKDLSKRAKEVADLLKKENSCFQTDRYYAYACGLLEKNNSDAKISGYVLVPQYMENTIKKQLKTACFNKYYTLITYKQVHAFFSELKPECLSETESKYLEEFLWAMEKHTKDVDNDFEEEMILRFYKKLQKLQN